MKNIKEILKVNYISLGLIVIFLVNYFYLFPLTEAFLSINNIGISADLNYFTSFFFTILLLWVFASNGVYLYGSQEFKENFAKVHIFPPLIVSILSLRSLFIPIMDIHSYPEDTGSFSLQLGGVICLVFLFVLVTFVFLFGDKKTCN